MPLHQPPNVSAQNAKNPLKVTFIMSPLQQRTSYLAIKVYLATVKNLHTEFGFPLDFTSMPLLHKTVQGISKRACGLNLSMWHCCVNYMCDQDSPSIILHYLNCCEETVFKINVYCFCPPQSARRPPSPLRNPPPNTTLTSLDIYKSFSYLLTGTTLQSIITLWMVYTALPHFH